MRGRLVAKGGKIIRMVGEPGQGGGKRLRVLLRHQRAARADRLDEPATPRPYDDAATRRALERDDAELGGSSFRTDE